MYSHVVTTDSRTNMRRTLGIGSNANRKKNEVRNLYLSTFAHFQSASHVADNAKILEPTPFTGIIDPYNAIPMF